MAFVALNHLSLSYPGYGFPANTSPPAISLYPSTQNRSTSPFPSRHFWKTQVSGTPKRTIHCSANASLTSEENVVVKEKSVSVILLAGGKGKRMGASMPKQYLPLLGQPIALYSLYTFSQMVEVKEIVVVCDPSYKDIFEDTRDKIPVDLRFTVPGKERQDSVYSGLQLLNAIFQVIHGRKRGTWYDASQRIDQKFGAIDPTAELVCIHDSARPLILSQDVEKVLKDGWLHGAAVLGVPAKATIKEANTERFVVKTLDRKTLWEMQTPQVIKPALLMEGFDLVNRKGLEVTDDVSIVEHLGHPVYITEGSYTNIKVTTPDDLLVAERILNPCSES